MPDPEPVALDAAAILRRLVELICGRDETADPITKAARAVFAAGLV